MRSSEQLPSPISIPASRHLSIMRTPALGTYHWLCSYISRQLRRHRQVPTSLLVGGLLQAASQEIREPARAEVGQAKTGVVAGGGEAANISMGASPSGPLNGVTIQPRRLRPKQLEEDTRAPKAGHTWRESGRTKPETPGSPLFPGTCALCPTSAPGVHSAPRLGRPEHLKLSSANSFTRTPRRHPTCKGYYFIIRWAKAL